MSQNEDSVRVYVYALCEPDGRTVRYIGATTDLWRRYCQHCRGSHRPEIRSWIASLSKFGRIPSLVILREVIGVESARQVESDEIRKHIAQYGDQILNDYYFGMRRQGGGRVAVCASSSQPLGKSFERMTHDQRRLRRRQMADAVLAGESREAVANRFGVTVSTVANALKEFSDSAMQVA